jgi:hypothetical protein
VRSRSTVPENAQQKLPKGVQESVPDSVHDTSNSGASQSHATGESIVLEAIQKAAPEGLEKALKVFIPLRDRRLIHELVNMRDLE